MFDNNQPPFKVKSEKSCMIAFVVIAIGFCLMVDLLREADLENRNSSLTLEKRSGFLSAPTQALHVPRMLDGVSEEIFSATGSRHVVYVPGNHPADMNDYKNSGTDGLGDVDDVEFPTLEIEIAYSESGATVLNE
jgi:hypothetical protein